MLDDLKRFKLRTSLNPLDRFDFIFSEVTLDGKGKTYISVKADLQNKAVKGQKKVRNRIALNGLNQSTSSMSEIWHGPCIVTKKLLDLVQALLRIVEKTPALRRWFSNGHLPSSATATLSLV